MTKLIFFDTRILLSTTNITNILSTMLACKHCEVDKPISEFRQYTASGRIAKKCKTCNAADCKYRSDPDRAARKRVYNRKYYINKIKPNLEDHYAKYEASYKLFNKRRKERIDSTRSPITNAAITV